MAIELKISGKCQGCPAAEPVLERFYAGSNTELVARCKNLQLCQHLEKHLMQYIDEHPYTGPELKDLDI